MQSLIIYILNNSIILKSLLAGEGGDSILKYYKKIQIILYFLGQ